MKKKLIVLVFCLFVFGLQGQNRKVNEKVEKQNINLILDHFNKAAAEAEFSTYFDFFDDESTFIGTDATEIWDKKQFMAYAKPHFEKKKTWNFKSLQRNIYFSEDGKIAWFDEVLDTQMKICRGSGVLAYKNGNWKIKQYVLSMTVPNEVTNKVVSEKANIEDELIQKLKLEK